MTTSRLLLTALALGLARPLFAGYVSDHLIANWDGLDSSGGSSAWVDTIGGRSFALTGVTRDAYGLTFAGSKESYGFLGLADARAVFEHEDLTVECAVGMPPSTAILFLLQTTADAGVSLGTYNSGQRLIAGTKKGNKGFYDTTKGATNTIAVVYHNAVVQNIFVDGVSVLDTKQDNWGSPAEGAYLGRRGSSTDYPYGGTIYALRVYDRALTADEALAHAQLDLSRFGNKSIALRSTGEPTAFGTVSPAYGERVIQSRLQGFSLEGAVRYGDSVVAYPSASGLERAFFRDVTLTPDVGEQTVVTETSFSWAPPADAESVTAEWAFEGLQVCLSLAQSGEGSADFYLDGEKVVPGDYWLEEGTNVTVRIEPLENGKYFGCLGSDGRAKTIAKEFSLALADRGLAVTARVERASFAGVTRKWKGAANARASVASNWEPEGVPETGDAIVLDDSCVNSFIWDVPVTPASWTQDGYTGTVTIETVYDSEGYSCLGVAGDVTLNSGTWTHKPLTKKTPLAKTYRLYVAVGGDLTVGADASISATGCGYWRQFLLNGGTDATGGRGGTYGGYGGWYSDEYHPSVYGAVPYGSITAPEDLGSGTAGTAAGAGGGAIRLDVGGTLSHAGRIDADTQICAYYSGSGGSVYIRAGAISGTGTVTANSRWNTGDYPSGSGGRIAIVLTKAGSTFASYDVAGLCEARAVYTPSAAARSCGGAPGTIYAETQADAPGRGWLIIKDGGNYTHADRDLCNGWPYEANATESARFARITVTNGASVVVKSGYSLDLSQTEFVTDGNAAVRNGIRLEGGTVTFPDENPSIGFWIFSSVADFSGLRGKNFTLTSSGYLEFNTASAALPGSWTFDEGSTCFVGKAAADVGAIALSVTNDLTVNGTIVHDGPYAADPEVFTLSVDGDLTVGATGLVDVNGKGYQGQFLPPGQSYGGAYASGSHGGWGIGGTQDLSPIRPYGSIYSPLTAGAGGRSNATTVHGGGILVIAVTGDFTNDGWLRADAVASSQNDYYAGAGGSVNITAATLTGTGKITADAYEKTSQHTSGGGGRVAVRLTKDGATFADYTGRISAAGEFTSKSGNRLGGAGSVYLRTAAQAESEGTLIVANWDAEHVVSTYGWTPIGGLVEGNAFGDVLIGDKAKLVVTENATMIVGGALSNGCAFAAQPGSSVVFAGTAESRVYGNLDFANVGSATPGKRIVFDDNAVINVAGEASFSGAVGNPVTLCSATQGQPWSLKGASLSLSGVALRDCQVDSPVVVMNGVDLGGNSANITFVNIAPGELVTWTGVTDGAWGTGGNWDKARVPIATDRILIPAGCANWPVLSVDVTVSNLTVAAEAQLGLNGKTLKVNGTCDVAGTLASGGTLATGGDVTLSGDCGQTALTLAAGGDRAVTLALGEANLRALAIDNPSVSVSGAITCSTFSAGDGTKAFDVAFAAGASLTAGHFAAAGSTATTNGVLRCMTPGGTWLLNATTYAVSGVAVSGSDARTGVMVVPADCRDDGDNLNWLFVDNRAHWQGTTSDFHTAENWSTGAEPDADTDVIVEGDQEVVVSSSAAVKSLAMAAGAKMTVRAPLTVAGSVTVGNGATLVWDVPGEIGGNLVLLPGATLTHTANGDMEAYKINLTVGGSMTVAADAKVTAKGRGYALRKGPGAAISGGPASHGGCSGDKDSYGSALCPTNCGSGGHYSSSGYTYAGGGAVKLAVGGDLTVDGVIEADAAMADFYSGSGGSVWLTAARLVGGGAIHANGGSCIQYGAGAGGRVSVRLVSAADFSGFAGTIAAYGGCKCNSLEVMTGNADSSPGTVYRETAADGAGGGTLTIANYPYNTYPRDFSRYCVTLPSALHGVRNELKNVAVVIERWGAVRLDGDVKVRDIVIDTPVTKTPKNDVLANLQLNGHVLLPRTKKHALGEDESVQVSAGDGGRIDWFTPGLLLIIR